jgi:hypothetical protein
MLFGLGLQGETLFDARLLLATLRKPIHIFMHGPLILNGQTWTATWNVRQKHRLQLLLKSNPFQRKRRNRIEYQSLDMLRVWILLRCWTNFARSEMGLTKPSWFSSGWLPDTVNVAAARQHGCPQ